MTFARQLCATILGLLALDATAAPQIQHWETSNGARVYFVESHELPMMQLRVVFDAGSARDPADRSGLAAFTNSMLPQGAGELDVEQIAEGFENLGAQFDGSSERDMASVQLRSLTQPDLLAPAIDLLATVLTKPSFPERSLERERQRALTALRQERQSPRDLVQRTFYDNLYGTHPYAHYPSGTEAGLTALAHADLVEFHRRYYVGANAVVAIVGDLRPKEARRMAEQVVGGLPRGERASVVPPVPARQTADDVRVQFPSTQSHLLVGQPGLKRGDPDYFPLYVGNYILGGGGLVSRISEEIREKNGLAYSAYSYFVPMREFGPFIIGLQTKNTQAERAVSLARETLRTFMADGPSAMELEAAKQHLTGSFPLRIDSNAKIAEYLAMIGFYGLPLTYLQEFNANIEAVTIDRIRDAFRRRVHPDTMLTVIVGNPQQRG